MNSNRWIKARSKRFKSLKEYSDRADSLSMQPKDKRRLLRKWEKQRPALQSKIEANLAESTQTIQRYNDLR